MLCEMVPGIRVRDDEGGLRSEGMLMVPGIRVGDNKRGLRSKGALFGELFDSLRKCLHAKWTVRRSRFESSILRASYVRS
jgi:hypothetical protein